MDLRIDHVLGKRPTAEPSAEIVDGAPVIDCRGCGIAPDPGTPECIGCMVSRMCEKGGSDRIVLRTGKDTEVSGKSGRILKETSSVMRWSVPHEEPKGRCRMCENSRVRIMDVVWGSFPGDGVSEARAMIAGRQDGNAQCDMCIMRTTRALDQIERGLSSVTARMREHRGGMQ